MVWKFQNSSHPLWREITVRCVSEKDKKHFIVQQVETDGLENNIYALLMNTRWWRHFSRFHLQLDTVDRRNFVYTVRPARRFLSEYFQRWLFTRTWDKSNISRTSPRHLLNVHAVQPYNIIVTTQHLLILHRLLHLLSDRDESNRVANFIEATSGIPISVPRVRAPR